MTVREITLARATLLAVMAAGLQPLHASAQGSERLSLRGERVAIYNLAGSIRLEPGSGNDVVVTVDRRGADGGRLRIESGDIAGREALRVIYPDERIVFSGASRESRGWGRTQLSVALDGTFGDDRGGRGRGERVEIVSSGRGFRGYADVRVAVPQGKRVEVYLAVGDATVSNVDGDISIDVHAADVTTTRTRGTLSLDTGSGDVSVTDAEGDVTLDSGSGGATLSGVKGGELRLDAGSGSVRASRIDVQDLSGDTGSGRVRFTEVRARNITLDSGSGSVELELLADVERLKIDAGSGSITVGIPESLGASLRIDTGSGGIDLDVPVTVSRRDRDSLSGSIGDGRGRIEIESGSGGVRLRRSGR